MLYVSILYLQDYFCANATENRISQSKVGFVRSILFSLFLSILSFHLFFFILNRVQVRVWITKNFNFPKYIKLKCVCLCLSECVCLYILRIFVYTIHAFL